MTAAAARRPALRFAAIGALTLLAVAAPGLGAPTEPPQGTDSTGAPAARARTARPPRAFLIYLIDGGDPLVVTRYVEEGDQIRFEKYGGWVGIARYEVLRIVPDDPVEPAPAGMPVGPPAATTDPLVVSLRGGANIKATGVAAEGDEVRVDVPAGSFTMARSDLVAVLRLPAAPAVPEAWLSLVTGDERPGTRDPQTGGVGLDPAAPARPVLGPGSDRPHVVRLASGQVLQVEGFWTEDGELRFKRLGGVVGIALAEIAGLLPQDLAPVRGRTAARFARQTGPDSLEVWVRGALQRVRLIGIEPVAGAHVPAGPWDRLDRGIVVYLEFDRQRYDPAGDWLAYVHLPSGRMLNTELIRTGLARPRFDARNVRYVDLFHEVAQGRHNVTPDPN